MAVSTNHNVSYRKIILLSLPIVLSNAMIPIQGLIDVAIIGHLPSPDYLSAVGLAAEFFSLLFVSFNFLQYTSSGLSAQALGLCDNHKLQRVLARGLLIAGIIGVMLIASQWLWAILGTWFFSISGNVRELFLDYFYVRILGAPIELANYVLFGWFVGQGKASAVLRQQLLISLSNICFNVFFVVILGYGVASIALGTVLAHGIGLAYMLMSAKKVINIADLGFFSTKLNKLFRGDELAKMMRLNRDIMIRTMILTLSFAWIMKLGAEQGELLLAANVILMQLLFICSYAIDGVAVTTESLVGQAWSNKNTTDIDIIVWRTTLTSIMIAIAMTILYFCIEPVFLSIMTNLPEVREVAEQYFVFAALVPVAGVLAYQFDGVMFGLTASTIIRNSIIFVAIVFFPLSTLMAYCWGNVGVWLSVYLLFALRAVTLIVSYKKSLVINYD